MAGGATIRPADDVRGRADRGERVAQLVREDREKLVLPAAGFLELGRAFGHAAFEVAIQLLELVRLPMQFDERRDLGPQDFRHDGHRQVIDGAAFVPAQPVQFGERARPTRR